MAFDIQEFLSNLNGQEGLVSPSHFLLVITPPPQLRNASIGAQELSLLCDRAQLPGITMTTVPIQQWGYGMTEQRPVKGDYSELSVSFLCDAASGVFDFFHKWNQTIYNINSNMRKGAYANGKKLFEFGYPSDFESIIDIYHYDNSGNEVIAYKVNGAYPKAIADTDVNWGDLDSIMRLNITFSYNYWTTASYDNGSAPPISGSSNYNIATKSGEGIVALGTNRG